MQRIKDDEIKAITFEVLKHIKRLCDSEGIRYFLAYGTTLGAMRHSGFIPWDDDVDVYMLRADFERYIEVDSRTGGRYRLACTESDPGYTLPLPKVIDTATLLRQTNQIETFELGVYVDVFVLDAVPGSERERHALYKKFDGMQHGWSGAQYAPTEGTGVVKGIVKRVLNTIGPRHFSQKLDNAAMKADSLGPTGYVCPLTYCVYGRERETYPLDWFVGGQRSLEFCGMDFPVPSKVEEYLTKVYGDYMQLPPMEERKSHHCFEAFWREADE